MPGFCDCGFDDLVQEEVPARLHPGIVVTIGPHPSNKEGHSTTSDLPSKGFSEKFPSQLEGAIEPRLYGEIISEINAYIKTGDDGGKACLACMCVPCTACGSFCIMRHYEGKWEDTFGALLKQIGERDRVKPRVEFFLGPKTTDEETGTKNYHPLQAPPLPPAHPCACLSRCNPCNPLRCR